MACRASALSSLPSLCPVGPMTCRRPVPSSKARAIRRPISAQLVPPRDTSTRTSVHMAQGFSAKRQRPHTCVHIGAGRKAPTHVSTSERDARPPHMCPHRGRTQGQHKREPQPPHPAQPSRHSTSPSQASPCQGPGRARSQSPVRTSDRSPVSTYAGTHILVMAY